MKRKKITTIEDLAVLMQDEFLAIHGRLDEHDSKFIQIDKRFEQVDKRFDKLEGKVNDMGHKINQIDRRLFNIEEDVAEIKVKQFGDLSKRVSYIERKLGIANAN